MNDRSKKMRDNIDEQMRKQAYWEGMGGEGDNPWGDSIDDASPEEWDKVRALDKQVGGKHYKEFAIQPIEFAMANELNYCEANIVKYACRHHMKGGIQDVDKIIHYAELLKELVYEQD